MGHTWALMNTSSVRFRVDTARTLVVRLRRSRRKVVVPLPAIIVEHSGTMLAHREQHVGSGFTFAEQLCFLSLRVHCHPTRKSSRELDVVASARARGQASHRLGWYWRAFVAVCVCGDT